MHTDPLSITWKISWNYGLNRQQGGLLYIRIAQEPRGIKSILIQFFDFDGEKHVQKHFSDRMDFLIGSETDHLLLGTAATHLIEDGFSNFGGRRRRSNTFFEWRTTDGQVVGWPWEFGGANGSEWVGLYEFCPGLCPSDQIRSLSPISDHPKS